MQSFVSHVTEKLAWKCCPAKIKISKTPTPLYKANIIDKYINKQKTKPTIGINSVENLCTHCNLVFPYISKVLLRLKDIFIV